MRPIGARTSGRNTRTRLPRPDFYIKETNRMSIWLVILIIVLVVLAFGGGGWGYSRRGR